MFCGLRVLPFSLFHKINFYLCPNRSTMKMLQPLLQALILTLAVSTAIGQNSILWEVSGNGLSNTSYILGTLKFIGEKEYVMHLKITEKLKTSMLFAIEDEVNHHAQHELNKSIHFPKGESLATVLSAEEYTKVENFFMSEFNISKKNFKKLYAPLKPLALSITMTRLSLREGVKFYDIELLKLAHDLRIDTYSLETIDRETAALNAFPMDAQVSALLHSVNNFEKQKEEYKQLEAAYLIGDIDRVFEYSLHPFEKNEIFIEEFYSKRNAEWLPKIEKMFSDQKSFVAIGVAHMEGDKGLLNLLKSKGYTLTPIALAD